MYTKQKRIKLSLFSGFLFIIVFLAMIFFSGEKASTTNTSTKTPPVSSTKVEKTFSYDGEDGKSAYEILTNKTTIKLDKSGLITSINNISANNDKKEFWAFYVNDKMAMVGPKELMTKNSDKIVWKLENY